jgi:methyl acetate hydrolase
MTTKLDQIVAQTVDSGAAHFVVGMVSSRDGALWHGSSGQATSTRAAGPDTVFSLYSCTKAIGSLMAIMAIDRGLITMDTPVGDVIPEFDELKVITGMQGNKPIYREPKSRVTLRHLLTHTSGMGYEAFYPLQAEYAEKTGAPPDWTGTYESLKYPLLFDPGEDFAYGIGTDWVGRVVSELDGRSIDRFVCEEILEPLGMDSTFFERAEAGDRLGDLMYKRDDGTFEPVAYYPPSEPEIYHMGHALYSSAADYLTFLRFMLNHGQHNGQQLVGRDAMEAMYTDQSGIELPSPVLKSSVPQIKDLDPCPGLRKTHTAGFVRNEEASPGMRSVGSLAWCGFHNTHYWVDPQKGIAAEFMTQMLPLFEPDFMSFFYEFERAVYAEYGD